MIFYINFLNHGLLEHTIEVIKDKELMREMKEYKHGIDLFRSRTKVCDFIMLNLWPDADPPKKQLQEVVKVKVGKSWEEYILRDLEEARHTLTSRFFLPDFALFLEKISKGSVIIIFCTTTNVAQIIRDELGHQPPVEDFSNQSEDMGSMSTNTAHSSQLIMSLGSDVLPLFITLELPYTRQGHCVAEQVSPQVQMYVVCMCVMCI